MARSTGAALARLGRAFIHPARLGQPLIANTGEEENCATRLLVAQGGARSARAGAQEGNDGCGGGFLDAHGLPPIPSGGPPAIAVDLKESAIGLTDGFRRERAPEHESIFIQLKPTAALRFLAQPAEIGHLIGVMTAGMIARARG
jgi:hypothetical protein